MNPAELLQPEQRLPSKSYLVNEPRKNMDVKCKHFSQSYTPR